MPVCSTGQACANETSQTEISPSDLFAGAYTEILLRGLLEIFCRDLANRHFAEILLAELLLISCTQIICGDFQYCKHLVQLVPDRKLALQRTPSTEIFAQSACKIRSGILQPLIIGDPLHLSLWSPTCTLLFTMLLERTLLDCCCASLLAGLILI